MASIEMMQVMTIPSAAGAGSCPLALARGAGVTPVGSDAVNMKATFTIVGRGRLDITKKQITGITMTLIPKNRVSLYFLNTSLMLLLPSWIPTISMEITVEALPIY